jgi:hypothetical protein
VTTWYPSAGTFTDSKGNTWTNFGSVGTGGGGPGETTYYVLSPTVGSGHTFSTTSGSSAICVAAFSNITAFQVDSQRGSGNPTIAPGPATGTGLSLAVTTVAYDNTTTLATVDSSYTIPSGCNLHEVGGSWVGVALAYLELPSGGSTNPTWTCGSTCGGDLVIFTETAAVVVNPPLQPTNIPIFSPPGILAYFGRLRKGYVG